MSEIVLLADLASGEGRLLVPRRSLPTASSRGGRDESSLGSPKGALLSLMRAPPA